jgi:hypothetical protein
MEAGNHKQEPRRPERSQDQSHREPKHSVLAPAPLGVSTVRGEGFQQGTGLPAEHEERISKKILQR